ncbi:MAG TPA: PsbP-related protein [Patescibacteria group bacterium]
MLKFSAQDKPDGKGFITSPVILVVGAVIVGIVVLAVASGSFKFSGSVNVDKPSSESVSQTDDSTSVSNPASNTGSNSKAELSDEPYSNSDLEFSINYPKGWEVKPQSTSVNIFLPSATKGAGQADALITVSSMPVGSYKDTKLSSIGDLQKGTIKEQFENTQIVGEKDTKVAGLNAYEIEFTGVLGGEPIRAKYYIISNDSDLLYSLIIFSAQDVWEDNQNNFASSLDTFKAL